MRRKSAGRLAALLCATGALLATPLRAAEEAPASPPPAEAFYRHPDVGSASLSPSGRYLGLTSRMKDRRVGLVVLDLQHKGSGKVVAHYSNIDVDQFEWVGDDRLVFDTVDNTGARSKQQGGRWGGLIMVEADGSITRELIQKDWPDGVSERERPGHESLNPLHHLLFVPQRAGQQVVIGQTAFNERRQLTHVTPMTLDVTNNRTRSMAIGAPEHVTQWVFDPNGEPRLGIATHGTESVFYWRAPSTQEWKEISRHDRNNWPYSPAFVGADGTLFVTRSEGPAGTSVLRRFDFGKNAPADEPLIRTAGFDFSGTPVRDDDGRVLGVRVQTDAEATVWFDRRLSQWQKDVDARMPGRVNRISCRRCASDDAVVLVHSWSDQDPGRFALYDPRRQQLEPIAAARPDIDPRRMATLDLHRIQTRDARQMPVWVTLPPGAGKGKPRAAIVLVHGGPWVKHGTWRWDEDAQFLASRGYVVIEPEFRGGRGYGWAWFRAGWKQWGRAMQDDVADATRWAAQQGYADPQKICIAGASYGGYSALMGLARDGELYRCGIAWAAVTDPRILADPHWSDWSDDFVAFGMPQLIGDPEKESALLAEVAPIELAARIKRPLLLAFGGVDRRVTPVHGTRLRAALREAGNEPEWVDYADEGHGWLKEANRADWARRMETFLAKNLQ